jgi:hypothetical protein
MNSDKDMYAMYPFDLLRVILFSLHGFYTPIRTANIAQTTSLSSRRYGSAENKNVKLRETLPVQQQNADSGGP